MPQTANISGDPMPPSRRIRRNACVESLRQICDVFHQDMIPGPSTSHGRPGRSPAPASGPCDAYASAGDAYGLTLAAGAAGANWLAAAALAGNTPLGSANGETLGGGGASGCGVVAALSIA